MTDKDMSVVVSSPIVNVQTVRGDEPSRQPPRNMRKSHDMLFSDLVMGRLEMDLFAMLLATAMDDPRAQEVRRSIVENQHKEESYELMYQFSTEALVSWLNIEKESVRGTMRQVAEKIMSRPVGLHRYQTKEDGFAYISPFRKIEWKRGVLSIIITGEALVLMLDITRGYGNVNLPVYFALKSAYAKRLYEMLSRFKFDSRLNNIPIETMRHYLGVMVADPKGKSKPKPTYAITANFIRDCIREPLKMISRQCAQELTLMADPDNPNNIGFRPIKVGHNVVAIEFLYRWTKEEEKRDSKQEIVRLERRRTDGQTLSIEEMQLLEACYRTVGNEDRANKIAEAIKLRMLSSEKPPKTETISSDSEFEKLQQELDDNYT